MIDVYFGASVGLMRKAGQLFAIGREGKSGGHIIWDDSDEVTFGEAPDADKAFA